MSVILAKDSFINPEQAIKFAAMVDSGSRLYYSVSENSGRVIVKSDPFSKTPVFIKAHTIAQIRNIVEQHRSLKAAEAEKAKTPLKARSWKVLGADALRKIASVVFAIIRMPYNVVRAASVFVRDSGATLAHSLRFTSASRV